MRQNVMDEVKKTFNPEFINRIDEIVVFHSLTKENISAILNVALKEVDKKLKEKQIKLELTQRAKDFLVEKGFDVKFGARPLLRTLQRELEDPLAENILVNQYPAGTNIVADFDEQTRKLTFAGAGSKTKRKQTVNV